MITPYFLFTTKILQYYLFFVCVFILNAIRRDFAAGPIATIAVQSQRHFLFNYTNLPGWKEPIKTETGWEVFIQFRECEMADKKKL